MNEMVINSNGAELDALRVAIEGMPEPPEGLMPAPLCGACGDSGMVLHVRNGVRLASDCQCKRERVVRARLGRCGIPERFAGARMATFETKGLDPSLGWAATMARGIEAIFPMVEKGLLLTGTCGIGKTHLAAALLASLVTDRGASGRFWEEGELLVQIKRGFAKNADAPSEGELFDDLKTVDVLVLDDLGSARVTDWSFDEIWQVIATRYNAKRLTVMTSNWPNAGVGEGRMVGGVREQTLGDRIGARAWSRLQEMCRPVEMVGMDFRRKRA